MIARKNKASDEDPVNPHDGDARIAKMKMASASGTRSQHAMQYEDRCGVGGDAAGSPIRDTTTVIKLSRRPVEHHGVDSDRRTSQETAEVHEGHRRWWPTKSADEAVVANLQGAEVRAYISEKKPDRATALGRQAQEQQAGYPDRRRVKEKKAIAKACCGRRGELMSGLSHRPAGYRREWTRHRLQGRRTFLRATADSRWAFNLSLIFARSWARVTHGS